MTEGQFLLPKSVERLLATLSKLYDREGDRRKQSLVVNARVRVHEQWSHDNWNGGIDGHAIYLTVPETVYVDVHRDRDTVQKAIKEDLNKLHNLQDEFIEEVFIEMESPESDDWRRESGALIEPDRRMVSLDAGNRIWGSTGFRVFLSHKAEAKVDAAQLKDGLGRFGAAAFVAHEDIHPTRKWQDEIENALSTMEAFIALMTEGFHESDWTDQEVGYALGRGVPIIALKLGRDPYGFIGRFQALSCGWNEAPREIVGLLMKHTRMVDSYIGAVEQCPSFEGGNTLAELLPHIVNLTPDQVDRLVAAFNENDQVRGSYGFKGSWPSAHGDGLAAHLARVVGQKCTLSSAGRLVMNEPR